MFINADELTNYICILFYIFIYLSGLCQILVAAHRLFIAMRGLQSAQAQ